MEHVSPTGCITRPTGDRTLRESCVVLEVLLRHTPRLTMAKHNKQRAAPVSAIPYAAWFPLAIVLAGIGAYANSFNGVFVLDDIPQIVHNKAVHDLWPLTGPLTASRPLVQLSLAINYAIGGTNVIGYHVVNLAIHLLAALVLYGVVRRTLEMEKQRDRFAGTAPFVALVVAVFWVVHPLTTQAVTYIVQRGESLMSLFYLLTLYAVIRGIASKRRGMWFAGAIAASALGMLCKPIMVTAPLVVLLYDRVFVGASIKEILGQRWRLYAGLAATWMVLAAVIVWGPKEWQDTAGSAAIVSAWEYARTQPAVVTHYLKLVFLPYPLCLDYGWPVAETAGQILPGAVLMGMLLAGTIWAMCRKPGLGFLGAFFFIVLAPSSSVLPIADLAFEHRMYLPLAAVIAVVVVSGHALLSHAAQRRGWTVAMRHRMAVGLLLACAGALMAFTIRRNRDYASELVLWQDVLAQNKDHYRAHHALGSLLAEAGKLDESVAHFKEVLRLKPRFADAHNNFANVLMDRGDVAGAIEHYRQAVTLKPRYVSAHYNLGRALAKDGKLEEAERHYLEALNLDPTHGAAHNNLGMVLARKGKVDDAIDHYRQAIRLNADHVEAYYNLGLALYKQQKYQEAVSQYEQALRRRPDYTEALVNLGLALIALDKHAEAASHLARAIQLKPKMVQGHHGMGMALEGQGKREAAADSYATALRLKPDFAPARIALERVRSPRVSSDTEMSVDQP